MKKMKVMKIKKYKYQLYADGFTSGFFEIIIQASSESNAEERAREILEKKGEPYNSVRLVGIEEHLAGICPGCGKPTIDWAEAEPMCDKCGWAQ